MRPARRRPRARAQCGRGRRPACSLRAEQARGGGQGAWLEGVRPPVPRPHAARAARRGDRLDHRPPGARHRPRRDRAHRPERGDGHAPRGQGGRERGVAPEDADHDREREARRRDLRSARRGAGARRHRRLPGRRQGPGRRTGDRRGHARDRGVRADRRERPGLEVDRRGRGQGHRARRPSRHGLHELTGHARPWRDGRDRDRHGHRGRSHLEHAQRRQAGEDTAHQAARSADDHHHDHGRRRPSSRSS